MHQNPRGTMASDSNRLHALPKSGESVRLHWLPVSWNHIRVESQGGIIDNKAKPHELSILKHF